MIAASHLNSPRWTPELWLATKPNLHGSRKHHGPFWKDVGHLLCQHDMPPQDTDVCMGVHQHAVGYPQVTPQPVPRDLPVARSVADPTKATLGTQHCAHSPKRGLLTPQNSMHTPTPPPSGDCDLLPGAKRVLPTLEMGEHPPDTRTWGRPRRAASPSLPPLFQRWGGRGGCYFLSWGPARSGRGSGAGAVCEVAGWRERCSRCEGPFPLT